MPLESNIEEVEVEEVGIKKYICSHCGGTVKGSFTFSEILENNKECKHCYFGTMQQREKRKDLFKGTQYVIPKSEFEKHVPKPRKEFKGHVKRYSKKEQERNRKNNKALEALFE